MWELTSPMWTPQCSLFWIGYIDPPYLNLNLKGVPSAPNEFELAPSHCSNLLHLMVALLDPLLTPSRLVVVVVMVMMWLGSIVFETILTIINDESSFFRKGDNNNVANSGFWQGCLERARCGH